MSHSRNLLPFRSIDDLTISVFPTGSAFTCDPPVLDTDVDFLVLVGNLDECGCRLDKYRFSNCLLDFVGKSDTDPGKIDASGYAVEDKYGMRFGAYRKVIDGKNINLIVTEDETLYLRSVGATLVAKHMNLMDKDERIALFRNIKYAEPYGSRFP